MVLAKKKENEAFERTAQKKTFNYCSVAHEENGPSGLWWMMGVQSSLYNIEWEKGLASIELFHRFWWPNLVHRDH